MCTLRLHYFKGMVPNNFEKLELKDCSHIRSNRSTFKKQEEYIK